MAPPTLRGPQPPRGPDIAAGAPPQQTAAHPLSDQRTLVSGWATAARPAGLACSHALPGAAGSRHSPLSRAHRPGLGFTHRSSAHPQTDKAGAEPVAAAAATSGAGPQLPGAPARAPAHCGKRRRGAAETRKIGPALVGSGGVGRRPVEER